MAVDVVARTVAEKTYLFVKMLFSHQIFQHFQRGPLSDEIQMYFRHSGAPLEFGECLDGYVLPLVAVVEPAHAHNSERIPLFPGRASARGDGA